MEEVGFTGDHKIRKWPSGPNIDDPDGTESTWKRVGNPNLPVAYNKGAKVTFFAKISLAPAPPPNVAVDLRVLKGSTIIATKNGVVLNAATTTVTSITATKAIENNVKKTVTTLRWQVKKSGGSWCDIGTSVHTMYWTYSTPMIPPFTNFSGTSYAPLYDLALEKACGYAASGGDTANADVIRERITKGIDGDINYDPGILVGDIHPLNAYSTPGGCLCADLAFLHRGLCRSLGIDGIVKFFWAGVAATWHFYAPYDASFRVLAAAHDSAGANPHFTYHALNLTGGKYHDPSYGIIRMGMTFDETAPGKVQIESAAWVTALPVDTGWTCPH